MSGLVSLSPEDNKELQSIQSLETIGSLKEVRMVDNEYYDLNVLGNMRNIKRLTVVDTKIKNADFILKLTKLKYLKTDDNSNLISLPDSPSTELEELNINCSKFENGDISFMNDLPSVEKLTFISAASLVPLNNMPNLEEMYLEISFRLQDLSPLGLKRLATTKGSNYYNTSDYSSIGKLKNLEYLNMSIIYFGKIFPL